MSVSRKAATAQATPPMTLAEEGAYFQRLLAAAPKPRLNKMRPISVTFDLGAPVCVTTPWVSFDGLIEHLMLLEALGSEYCLTPKKHVIRWSHSDYYIVPIKYHDGLRHASVSQFIPGEANLRCTTIYKRFEADRSENLKSRRVYIGHGYYRGYMLKEPYIPANQVVFYVYGDPIRIGELIDGYLIGLGNDTRIGFGAIRSWRIDDTPEDWSLVRDGRAMRPIPVELCAEYEDAVPLAQRAPYWDPRNVCPCVPPGARCVLK